MFTGGTDAGEGPWLPMPPMTSTETPTPTEARQEPPRPTTLLRRISRLEWTVAAVAAVVLAGLVAAEPDILEAPLENTRSLVFTVGGTLVAAVALVTMLWLRVPPAVRVAVLTVPFVAVSWWLISPFFVDDVVNDDFQTSIADASGDEEPVSSEPDPAATPADSTPTTEPMAAAGPTLVGSGQFVGLAGHSGTGDAGFFTQEDGSAVLRLENLDIQNGPDLQLYVVPGADRTTPDADSVHLGALRGNVGNQTYELPADFSLTSGDWTVLVWCEAFTVEFVGATVTVA